MIIGLQIIALVFSFMMIYFALLNYKRKEITKLEFSVWVIIWISVSFVVIFPEFLRSLSMRFFITRLFDAMVVGGFLLVILMTSIIYVKVRRMENKLEELIRKDALKNVEKKSK